MPTLVLMGFGGVARRAAGACCGGCCGIGAVCCVGLLLEALPPYSCSICIVCMPYCGDRIGVSADRGLPCPRCSGLLSVLLAVSLVAGVEGFAVTMGAVGVVFRDMPGRDPGVFSASPDGTASFCCDGCGDGGVAGLLMMLRYQNIRLEIRTCSYRGRLGFANLIWLSRYTARST